MSILSSSLISLIECSNFLHHLWVLLYFLPANLSCQVFKTFLPQKWKVQRWELCETLSSTIFNYLDFISEYYCYYCWSYLAPKNTSICKQNFGPIAICDSRNDSALIQPPDACEKCYFSSPTVVCKENHKVIW